MYAPKKLRCVKRYSYTIKDWKGKTPHYQVHLQGETGVDYRIAINVKSQSYPSEVLYFASNNIKSERFIFYRHYHSVLQK